jgi:hypothetical protein
MATTTQRHDSETRETLATSLNPASRIAPNPEPIPKKRATYVPRRRPVAAGCQNALALLARHPITHTPIPRLHVDRVRQAGTLSVLDRASGDRFTIYTPRFESQFRDGHRFGLWYARPNNAPGTRPVSQGFATAKEAIDALRQGRWTLDHTPTRPLNGPLPRVFWSAHNAGQ